MREGLRPSDRPWAPGSRVSRITTVRRRVGASISLGAVEDRSGSERARHQRQPVVGEAGSMPLTYRTPRLRSPRRGMGSRVRPARAVRVAGEPAARDDVDPALEHRGQVGDRLLSPSSDIAVSTMQSGPGERASVSFVAWTQRARQAGQLTASWPTISSVETQTPAVRSPTCVDASIA